MNIPLEAMMAAVAEAIKKGIGRKNLVAITAMVILAVMAEAPLALCLLVAGVAAAAILTQWTLDLYEVRLTGRDQADNGHAAGDARSVQTETTGQADPHRLPEPVGSPPGPAEGAA